MPNHQEKKTEHERRVLASFRVRACAAGLCAGAQIYLAGCAVGMPLTLGSAWLAALAALALCVWITVRCHRTLARYSQKGTVSRPAYAFVAAALLLSAAFSLSSMVCYAGETLVAQTRGIWTAAMAWIAISLCALPGPAGAARICFAMRYAFPPLVLGLGAAAVPWRIPVGLFPLLGAGATELGAAAVCMLFGAAPALMLALPPPELAGQAYEVPQKAFFLRRMLAGALAGVLLLFLSSACTTYESILESTQWGARLHMAAGNLAREGIAQMLLTVTKLLAMLLLAANMLCAAEQALTLAFPALAKGRIGLALLLFLLLLSLSALIVLGEKPLLIAAPAIAIPAALAAWILGRRRRA
ncbi:MAG: hypothetical protein IJ418_08675 [Clostridia bacterium]|nr:hypothetical protein [Clostridia bacterium]